MTEVKEAVISAGAAVTSAATEGVKTLEAGVKVEAASVVSHNKNFLAKVGLGVVVVLVVSAIAATLVLVF